MDKQPLLMAVLIAALVLSSIHALALTQDEAMKTAESYGESTILPEEKLKLAERYSPGTVTITRTGIITNKMRHIEDQGLWFAPLEIEFQIQKEGSSEGQSSKLFIPLYVDERSNSVSPALSKIVSPDVFACSDKATSTCSGVFISISDGGTIQEVEGRRGGVYVPNQEALSRYETILKVQHRAQKNINYWYVPSSELKAIAEYPWIVEIQPNNVGTLAGSDPSPVKRAVSPGVWWIAAILASALIAFMGWKKSE